MKRIILIILCLICSGCSLGQYQYQNQALIYDDITGRDWYVSDYELLLQERKERDIKENILVEKVNKCETQKELDQFIYMDVNWPDRFQQGFQPGKFQYAIIQKKQSFEKAKILKETGQSSIGYDIQKELEYEEIMNRVLKKFQACSTVDSVIEAWQEPGIGILTPEDRNILMKIGEKKLLNATE